MTEVSDPEGKVVSPVPDYRALLAEVMEWIDNWDPNFAYDEEWVDTEARVKAALA